ncbi:hypothetical protein [Marinicella sp. W31]|uniref:hypothetical protein n=1 Tax=Marinicella sp. W31 TaxID=3023713 RepID=UPI003757C302
MQITGEDIMCSGIKYVALLMMVLTFYSNSLFSDTYTLGPVKEPETMPIEDCAVYVKVVKSKSCMGTGANNDPARDLSVYYSNQCTKNIALKQCFLFPDGRTSNDTETIKPGKTQKFFVCTKMGTVLNGGSSDKRQQPKFNGYFVWDPEVSSSYKYKCKE